MVTEIDIDNLEALKVTELKALLKQRQLQTGGKKQELIERLREAMDKERSIRDESDSHGNDEDGSENSGNNDVDNNDNNRSDDLSSDDATVVNRSHQERVEGEAGKEEIGGGEEEEGEMQEPEKQEQQEVTEEKESEVGKKRVRDEAGGSDENDGDGGDGEREQKEEGEEDNHDTTDTAAAAAGGATAMDDSDDIVEEGGSFTTRSLPALQSIVSNNNDRKRKKRKKESRDVSPSSPSPSPPTPLASSQETLQTEPQEQEPSAETEMKETTATATTEDTASGVPSPKRDPTDTLLISNFTRPCRETDVRALLTKRGGALVEMWMNAIKSLCYAQFEQIEQAAACRDYVYGRKWSHDSKLPLEAEFVDVLEMKKVIAQDAMQRKKAEEKRKRDLEEREQKLKEEQEREQRRKEEEERAYLESKPRELDLDQLFRKTRAQPPLYWLPLTEEQIARKAALPAEQNRREPLSSFDMGRRDSRRGPNRRRRRR